MNERRSDPPSGGASARPSILGARFQRWVWDRRASSWDQGGASGLSAVVSAVLTQAAVTPGMKAVDLGCGSGQLTLPLARQGAVVTGVDLSPKMISLLTSRAEDAGLRSLTGLVAPMEEVRFRPASCDLVVSNYALHHLGDSKKQAVLEAAARWLRPGGRLVVGDMMFGRGRNARDRAIIASKVATLARRGPGGWWRVAKNVVRFSLRIQEQPVSIDTWVRYFERAGLTEVVAIPVVAEAAVVTGIKH